MRLWIGHRRNAEDHWQGKGKKKRLPLERNEEERKKKKTRNLERRERVKGMKIRNALRKILKITHKHIKKNPIKTGQAHKNIREWNCFNKKQHAYNGEYVRKGGGRGGELNDKHRIKIKGKGIQGQPIRTEYPSLESFICLREKKKISREKNDED